MNSCQVWEGKIDKSNNAVWLRRVSKVEFVEVFVRTDKIMFGMLPSSAIT
jgi:hypothetical protein